MTNKKIEGTNEAWESRELGADEKFAQSVDFDNAVIDDALDLQMISIRIQKSLLEDLKVIANLNGLGYQPLMKQVLQRFVDCEKKKIFREETSRRLKEMEEEKKAAEAAAAEEAAVA